MITLGCLKLLLGRYSGRYLNEIFNFLLGIGTGTANLLKIT